VWAHASRWTHACGLTPHVGLTRKPDVRREADVRRNTVLRVWAHALRFFGRKAEFYRKAKPRVSRRSLRLTIRAASLCDQCWGVRCPHSLSPSEPFCVRNWELLSCREKKRWGERNKSQFFVTYLGGNLQLSPLVDSWYCPPNCCPTTRLTLHYC
jgi:hypothetical protein